MAQSRAGGARHRGPDGEGNTELCGGAGDPSMTTRSLGINRRSQPSETRAKRSLRGNSPRGKRSGRDGRTSRRSPPWQTRFKSIVPIVLYRQEEPNSLLKLSCLVSIRKEVYGNGTGASRRTSG